jgi:hypothetical protein
MVAASGYATLDQWVEGMARFPIDNHIVGSADTVIEKLKYHEEDLGLTYPLLNVGWGLMPRDKTLASMRRIAEKVMPHFEQPSAAGEAVRALA